MKVLHMISGGETGGSKKHLIDYLNYNEDVTCDLMVFQHGELYEAANLIGINVYNLKQNSRYDFTSAIKILKLIKSNNYDIVHTHGARANLYMMLLNPITNVKWVTTVHSDPSLDFMNKGLKGKIFSKLNIFSFRFIDHLLAVSKPTIKLLNNSGVSNGKISLIYNGTNFLPSKYSGLSRSDLKLKESDFVITMVARLHPVKGHKDVIEALKMLDNSNYKLLVAGDGDEYNNIKTLVTDYNLSDQVLFLGFRSDIPDLYAISDIGILASYSETFPLSLLEAAKERTPVISTQVGGVNEMLADYGWIVRSNQPSEIADAIVDASSKKHSELHELGDQFYNHVKQNYSIEKFVNKINNIYYKIS